jgi:hypothetical protein
MRAEERHQHRARTTLNERALLVLKSALNSQASGASVYWRLTRSVEPSLNAGMRTSVARRSPPSLHRHAESAKDDGRDEQRPALVKRSWCVDRFR